MSDELFTNIRVVCYASISLFMIFRSAYGWHRREISLLAIDALVGLFMLSSFHYAITRSPLIARFFTTPLLVALLVMVVIHTYIWFRRGR